MVIDPAAIGSAWRLWIIELIERMAQEERATEVAARICPGKNSIACIVEAVGNALRGSRHIDRRVFLAVV